MDTWCALLSRLGLDDADPVVLAVRDRIRFQGSDLFGAAVLTLMPHLSADQGFWKNTPLADEP